MSERYGQEAVEFELIAGKGGVFEVEWEGEKIYSKKETGAFPRYGEIPMTVDMKRVNQ